jgi:hypothetical protein
VNYRAAHGVLDILSIIVRNVKFYWEAIYCLIKPHWLCSFPWSLPLLVPSCHWISCLRELSSFVDASCSLSPMQTCLWIFRNRAIANVRNHLEMLCDFPSGFSCSMCALCEINHHLVIFFGRKTWVKLVAEGKSGITEQNRCCGLCPGWFPRKGCNSRDREKLSPPEEAGIGGSCL